MAPQPAISLIGRISPIGHISLIGRISPIGRIGPIARQSSDPGSTLHVSMNLLPIRRIPRLFLAVCVSAWIAGAGCLLGCSNEAHAASSNTANSVETIVATDSCAASHSHDCCAKKRNAARKNEASVKAGEVLVTALPSRAMEPCPMAVNASAIVSKSQVDSSSVPATKSVEPLAPHDAAVSARIIHHTSNLFNRGPTYIRCCVFLI